MKKIMIPFISLLVVSSMAQAAADKQKRVYKVQAMAEPPVFDGETERDRAWEKIPLATDFIKMGSTELFEERRQTQFRMAVTEDALYIGIMCLEPEGEKLSVKAKDGEVGIASDDGVEIFLFPEGADTYFQFMVGAKGARWNGRDIFSPEMPLADWQVNSFQEHRYYSVEIRIPFKLLGVIPEKGEVWRGNICRNVVLDGSRRSSCWSKQKLTYHDAENFGEFVFVDSVASPEALRKRITDTRQEIAVWLEKTASLQRKLRAEPEENPSVRQAIETLSKKHDVLRAKVSASNGMEFAELKELLVPSKELFVEADTLMGRVLLNRLVQ